VVAERIDVAKSEPLARVAITPGGAGPQPPGCGAAHALLEAIDEHGGPT
jgi:hypothetical protein